MAKRYSGLLGLVALMALLSFSRADPAQRRELIQSYSASDKPVTVPYNMSLVPGSEDLPCNDPRIVPKSNSSIPEQIHLAYFSSSEMMVTYVTGNYQMGGNVSEFRPPPYAPSIVWYATSPMGPFVTAIGKSQTYTQIYTFPELPNFNYSSPRIHHVLLTGLKPSTTYYYAAGVPVSQDAPLRSFRTLPPVGGFPLKFGIIGDLGLTYNSSSTFDHLKANSPDMALLIGDLSYADAYMTNGTMAPYLRNTPATPISPHIMSLRHGSYQPKWDMWGRLTQPLFSKVPLQTIVGNHEIEPQFSADFNSSKVKFVAYSTRYPMPHRQSGSSDPNYFSYDVGGVHFIALSSYVDFQKGSPQFQWLEADLRRVDRSVTPWLIVKLHAPFYVSYISHYMENECMRQEMEALLYEHKVDLVFSGHVHAYERTFPVFNFKRNDCAPAHITIGDGGNIEKLYRTYADDPGKCPEPGRRAYSQPQYCPNFPFPGGPKGGFCSTEQPPWSAYRDPSFGHGILEVLNATHAVWEWHRNQDAADVVSDRTLFVRAPNCGLQALTSFA